MNLPVPFPCISRQPTPHARGPQAFLAATDPVALLPLICAADFLRMTRLLDLACVSLANQAHGVRTADAVAALFAPPLPPPPPLARRALSAERQPWAPLSWPALQEGLQAAAASEGVGGAASKALRAAAASLERLEAARFRRRGLEAAGTAVTGGNDGLLRVWSLHDGRCLRTFRRHTAAVEAVAALGGGRVASGGWDGSLRVWDVLSGEELLTVPTGRESHISCAAPLPGDRVATGQGRSVMLWDLSGGTTAAAGLLQGHSWSVYCLALAGSGLLASGSEDKSVRLWDVDAGTCVAALYGHRGPVTSLAPLPGGHLLTGSSDRSLRVWGARRSEAGASASAAAWECLAAVENAHGAPDGLGGEETDSDGWGSEPDDERFNIESVASLGSSLGVAAAASGTRGGSLRVWAWCEASRELRPLSELQEAADWGRGGVLALAVAAAPGGGEQRLLAALDAPPGLRSFSSGPGGWAGGAGGPSGDLLALGSGWGSEQGGAWRESCTAVSIAVL